MGWGGEGKVGGMVGSEKQIPGARKQKYTFTSAETQIFSVKL